MAWLVAKHDNSSAKLAKVEAGNFFSQVVAKVILLFSTYFSTKVQGLGVPVPLESEGFFLHDRSRWLGEMAENPGKRLDEPEDRPWTCSDLCLIRCLLRIFQVPT